MSGTLLAQSRVGPALLREVFQTCPFGSWGQQTTGSLGPLLFLLIDLVTWEAPVGCSHLLTHLPLTYSHVHLGSAAAVCPSPPPHLVFFSFFSSSLHGKVSWAKGEREAAAQFPRGAF